MSDEKIIQRVKSLLAMAEDTASPHEATIAARRARALMDKHQIEKEDITSDDSIVFGEVRGESAAKAYEWLKLLAAAAGEINDCKSIISRRYRGVSFDFRGFASDAVIASSMMSYFKASCELALSKSDTKGRAAKNAFRYHYSLAIFRKAGEIVGFRANESAEGKQLVVVKKQLIEQHYGDDLKKSRPGKIPELENPDVKKAAIKGQIAGEATPLQEMLDDEEAA
ncbi:MAG: DUF2786 domain-containing protein [Oceanobacter sp.]